jgi:hypothetical protein
VHSAVSIAQRLVRAAVTHGVLEAGQWVANDDEVSPVINGSHLLVLQDTWHTGAGEVPVCARVCVCGGGGLARERQEGQRG